MTITCTTLQQRVQQADLFYGTSFATRLCDDIVLDLGLKESMQGDRMVLLYVQPAKVESYAKKPQKDRLCARC